VEPEFLIWAGTW